MLDEQIGHTVEAYIDDLVVKSKKESNHLRDLAEVFDILKLHKLRLNPEKCAFGVSAGKFLGHLVTRRGQVLADFIAELTPQDTKLLNTLIPTPTVAEHQLSPKPWHLFQGDIWRLHVDGASNSNGAGAGVVLVSPCGTLHESAISIDFPATNNEAEYEALLAGLRSAVAMEISNLVVYCDSQLIVNQVLGDYEARDPRMSKYQATVAELITHFPNFKIEQINREHNAHADALAGLALASKATEFRTISFGNMDHPSFDTTPKVLNVELGPSWMDEIIAFLKNDTLPADKKEAYRIRNKAAHYWLSESGQLYRKSISGPYLHVVHPTQPAQNLSPITSLWPFAQWGLDIVGKLPTAPGGFNFLITATDYFSKWVEAKPLVTITEADVRRFVWRNIVTRFGVPYAIVSDNGSQFVSKDLTSLCDEFGIRFFNSTRAYPQGNGQAEATNKTVCAGIKRRIENFDPKTNEEAVQQELILAEEKRDDAQLKLAEYQQQVARGYNRSVRTKTFKPNDLVWRKVVQAK
ncbi:uncharacterized protein LOC131317340 [Rhododendron vialii]|uniref:uncharacterized protein LOC131317340 n=1 Tax=Rhododendron vialii TaxID=182163 RepID=UPI00265F03C5|nr:uncharacterized protein LOC131317340 [Rhododendron vialii]